MIQHAHEQNDIEAFMQIGDVIDRELTELDVEA
jgi:hypothetical protein